MQARLIHAPFGLQSEPRENHSRKLGMGSFFGQAEHIRCIATYRKATIYSTKLKHLSGRSQAFPVMPMESVDLLSMNNLQLSISNKLSNVFPGYFLGLQRVMSMYIGTCAYAHSDIHMIPCDSIGFTYCSYLHITYVHYINRHVH